MPTIFRGNHDGRGRRFAIVVSRFSKVRKDGKPLGEVLLEGCLARLREAGVAERDLYIAYVPGAFELPLAAKALADRSLDDFEDFDDDEDEDSDDEEDGDLDFDEFGGTDEAGTEFTNGNGNGNGHGRHDDSGDGITETEITIEGELVEPDHVDAVIALGCIIRGETPHFEYVAGETARGLCAAGLATDVPVIFGVLTCNNSEQALARCGGEAGHIGIESAEAALETANLHVKIREWNS